MRNYCGYGEEDGTGGNKPYTDAGTITNNAWAMNYYGNAVCGVT
jgi:hypothetical protein